ncbi:MAG: diguanylate cyclase, partial [Acidobacteriota bacterium]|nr:diguanylate cyclase [Acidobacteriota bacterium]
MNVHAIVVQTVEIGALLLASFFLFLYRRKRQDYLLAWAVAWFLMALFFFARIAVAYMPDGAAKLWYRTFDEMLVMVSALAFYCAARLYVRVSVPYRLLGVAAALCAVWAGMHVRGLTTVNIGLGVGLMFLLIGQTFWSEGHRQEARADILLGITFLAWGLLFITMVFQSRISFLRGQDLLPLMLLPEMFTCVLMVMTVYEDERRRVERDMLALSNLNLATSSFVGAEIQKMLAQALDRVLSVARIPSGALCMRYGESDGPTSVMVTGLEDSFCRSLQEGDLDSYVVNLVARLGGLVVLRDLARDADWEALEKEPSFGRLRRVLLDQRLRTVVGISLQTKQRVFGVLLLGTNETRSFTAAERRLLLALGHQIGMAVENSYLVQQSSRRSEELHILNEIGCALNSTLDLNALLERICTEMRRVVDANSFFIAFYEPGAPEVRFEIEVTDSERQPKRARPCGNHMVEYIVRSAQPLLIRDHFAEETRRLGFETMRQVGSICAVPLIVYERPIGVMVAHSMKERVFDDGHVEILRVLASEASIAIENARLFAEEQKKAHQLQLINSVTGHAIDTLDPTEMLSKIVAEMESHLGYDHIGIALLDYSAKELVIQAEAGSRRDALGRRVALDDGLIGHVARSGQIGVVRNRDAASPRLVLADSVASVALPISYAEKFLGVLYVESAVPREFPEQEITLLRTLADLFAGALQNALTFQRAQEQAITDGLTGVKTHRFLMEALSSEWKRSTRANRPFALALMDLDRFKFVNDFYGHLEGDVVLQRVGHILEEHCRRSDVVARYGGDEFVILMPEATVEQARQLANKLRTWIASDSLLRDKNVTASFGIAAFPVHGSTPQELIQVADSSMYLSKHQGGNSVSSSEQGDPTDRKRWKKDVLEAYLGVTLKRLFSTGPEAFDEIYRRLEHFTRSLEEQGGNGNGEGLPPAVVETVTSLALAIDAKDHYTQGHSQKVSTYAAMIAEALGMPAEEIEEIRLAGLL